MATATQPDEKKRIDPVMRVTAFEKVSTWLYVIVFALILTVALLAIIYMLNRPPKPTNLVAVEMFELPGGKLDGKPDDTLEVDSPEEEITDPSIDEEKLEENEIEETLDVILEESDTAVEQLPTQLDVAAETSGNPGSSKGTGGHPLGFGPGKKGFPSEDRWIVRFSDSASLDEYAKQLQFFGIELGALDLKNPPIKFILLKNLTSPVPKKDIIAKGSHSRLKKFRTNSLTVKENVSKLKLFKRAGVDLKNVNVFALFPRATEQKLLNAELRYRNRKPKEIKKTFFKIVKAGAGYKFEVTRQDLHR